MDLKDFREPDDSYLAELRSHEFHLRYIYGLRLAALFVAAVTIILGGIMVFKGLQGSFNWAFQAAHTLTAKLTNASPGIVFATVGLIIVYKVVSKDPVDYDTPRMHLGAPPRRTLSGLQYPKKKSAKMK